MRKKTEINSEWLINYLTFEHITHRAVPLSCTLLLCFMFNISSWIKKLVLSSIRWNNSSYNCYLKPRSSSKSNIWYVIVNFIYAKTNKKKPKQIFSYRFSQSIRCNLHIRSVILSSIRAGSQNSLLFPWTHICYMCNFHYVCTNFHCLQICV